MSKTGFGAFTGETSVLHAKDLGLTWTLIGHSERRCLYGECDSLVAEKSKFLLENGFNIVLCIGENLAEWE